MFARLYGAVSPKEDFATVFAIGMHEHSGETCTDNVSSNEAGLQAEEDEINALLADLSAKCHVRCGGHAMNVGSRW